MLRRGKASAVVGAALIFAVSGADAASHGSSGGSETHSNGTPTRVRPALQACTGPTHQCGKPTGLKCQIVSVERCRHTCYIVKEKQCSN
jgi:hypothetical protein